MEELREENRKIQSKQMIWEKSRLREIVSKYRMIPEFIGNESEIVQKVREPIPVCEEPSEASTTGQIIPPYRTKIERLKLLKLPVYLWSEQLRYILEHENNQVDRKGKRKRESNTHEEDEDCPQEKRSRTLFPFLNSLIHWWNQSEESSRSSTTGVGDISPSSAIQYVMDLFKSSSSPQEAAVEEEEEEPQFSVSPLPPFTTSEEWFRYQVFYFFQHYKVMQHPLPLDHSLLFFTHQKNSQERSKVFSRVFKTDHHQLTNSSSRDNSLEEVERKYLIGPGDIYGGDYTLYQGVDSPSEGHSLATIQINYSTKIPALNLLAFSRVQNKVAKAAIIAFPAKDLPPRTTTKPEMESEPVHFLKFTFRAVATRFD